MEEFVFSAGQQHVFDLYQNGYSFLISGQAGVGKTQIIKHIKRDAEAKGKVVHVCAMTGAASVLLESGAKTLHSWAGIGLGKGKTEELIPRLFRNAFLKEMYRKTDILIIDEVSMLSMKLFEMLDDIARVLRFPFKGERPRFGQTIGKYSKSSYPFGGIQLICSGDFYQLPPIGESKEERAFCFESERWEETFGEHQIQLKQIFRQKDPVFSGILNEIRIGKLKKSNNSLLMQHVQRQVNLEETGGVWPTKIFPTKRKVEAFNLQKMAELPANDADYTYQLVEHYDLKSENIMMQDTDNMLTQLECSKDQLERELAYLKNNVLCDVEVRLKIGAQVMCIINHDVSSPQPICNGSQGIITGFQYATSFSLGNNKWETQAFPEVQFQNGRQMLITPHVWRSEKIIGVGVSQIPLILSWAITIHKSQGATLDMADLDVGRDVFECGQTYVAMSRVKSLEGLYLSSFDYKKIQVHPKVRAFYESLEQVQEQEEQQVQAQVQEQEEIPMVIAVPITEERQVKEIQIVHARRM